MGLFTLRFARAVGESGRVIAVEPDPHTAMILTRNLEMNRCNNVEVLNCALSNKPGQAKLFRDASHPGVNSLCKTSEASSQVEVILRRGDEVLSELGVVPKLVKIDVEGHEPQVIAGLGYRPEIMMVEFVPNQLRVHGNGLQILLTTLLNLRLLAQTDPNVCQEQLTR